MAVKYILFVHGIFWGWPTNIAVSVHPLWAECEAIAAETIPPKVSHACVAQFEWMSTKWIARRMEEDRLRAAMRGWK